MTDERLREGSSDHEQVDVLNFLERTRARFLGSPRLRQPPADVHYFPLHPLSSRPSAMGLRKPLIIGRPRPTKQYIPHLISYAMRGLSIRRKRESNSSSNANNSGNGLFRRIHHHRWGFFAALAFALLSLFANKGAILLVSNVDPGINRLASELNMLYESTFDEADTATTTTIAESVNRSDDDVEDTEIVFLLSFPNSVGFSGSLFMMVFVLWLLALLLIFHQLSLVTCNRRARRTRSRTSST